MGHPRADSSGNRTHLYAIWEDHRTSATDNAFYDVFWARRTGSGTPGPWAPNLKLMDAQSPSDLIFLGDYYDLAIAGGGDSDSDGNLIKSDDDNGRFVYGVWTDRRDELTIFDFDDDIWGFAFHQGTTTMTTTKEP